VRIGELADRAGVPVRTIRYYEDIGVLGPPVRTPSGYRHYDAAMAGQVAFVWAAQAVGVGWERSLRCETEARVRAGT
jgi:DNA-binding transcriptional MerR regulator